MPKHTCGSEVTRAESEVLFSGYIDGVLTQGDEQRIRLRLESCVECHRMVEELRVIRENARTTKFNRPADEDWDENTRSPTSNILRSIGWVLVILWLAVNLVGLFVLPEVTESTYRWLLGLSLAGWSALLVSVLLDRMKRSAADRYGGVIR